MGMFVLVVAALLGIMMAFLPGFEDSAFGEPTPDYVAAVDSNPAVIEAEWAEYNLLARIEYGAEFDAIFASLDVTSKRTDKGLRVTVRRENGRIARSYTVKGNR